MSSVIYTSDMTYRVGFFTQHELDPVVGTARTRERWEGHLLPRGSRIRAYGQQAIIFPEFVVASVVANNRIQAGDAMLGRIQHAAESLYRSSSFQTISSTLRPWLQGRTGWTLSDIVVLLREQSEDALLSWNEEIVEAEVRLGRYGISFDVRLGRIAALTDHGYRVELYGALDTALCPFRPGSHRLDIGSWVSINSVTLGALKGDVLMPAVEPDLLGLKSSELDEADWEELFAGADFVPTLLPSLADNLSDDDASSTDRDVIRPRRRIRINLDSDLYLRGNTMVRRAI